MRPKRQVATGTTGRLPRFRSRIRCRARDVVPVSAPAIGSSCECGGPGSGANDPPAQAGRGDRRSGRSRQVASCRRHRLGSSRSHDRDRHGRSGTTDGMAPPTLDSPPILRDSLAPQILAGGPITHREYDWEHGRFGPDVTVAPGDRLVLEGVGSAHPALAGIADLRVWVWADPVVCAERVLVRDGELTGPTGPTGSPSSSCTTPSSRPSLCATSPCPPPGDRKTRVRRRPRP